MYNNFMKKLIVLTGMMGAGKSYVGQLLSRKLKYKLIDIDKEIELSQNMSITAIFNEHGEKYFRKIEKEIIEKFSNNTETVISLGGGAFENEHVRNLLKEKGEVIYLKATPQSLFKRIHTEIHRPLLRKDFSVDTIAFILKKRAKNYEQAHYIIETDNKTRKDIVRKILGVLK